MGIRRAKKKIKKERTRTARKLALKAKPRRKPLRARKPTERPSAASPQEAKAEEIRIEEAKYYPRPQVPKRYPFVHELPQGYAQDKIVVQVRDPYWLHAYWELTGGALDKLRSELKDAFSGAKRTLRVYDVSHIIFDGTNAHRYFDIEINEYAANWYIDVGGPGRSWCVDLGLKFPDGRFITIIRSNTVHTPLDGPSWITDEEWMIPEDMFAKLYGMGVGLGRSSPVGKAWQERVKKALFSGVLASPGMASMASPVKKAVKERRFWLMVDAELIVYGATEADARVYVQNRKIKLRPDGTFTLRFALPDGTQVIPVKAVSYDDEEERVITPVVTRETKKVT